MSISIERAVEIIREAASRQEKDRIADAAWQKREEVLPLAACRGRELAEDLIARLDQPPFLRSTMDGYAVTGEDRQRMAEQGVPYRLRVACTIDAGDTAEYRIRPGEAARIMTGASIPQGAALVVPQEETVPEEDGDQYVRILELPERDNIAPIGEDFYKGEVLAAAGTICDSYLLSCAAAAGWAELTVRPRRRAAVISTGDELVPAGSCQPEELRPGQIFDSNRVYVAERLRELGCDLVYERTVADESLTIQAAFREALAAGAELIVTTGGVSVGEKDLLEPAVREVGGEILFHGIRLKPGMPTMAARLGGALLLALSGNPYSASAVLELLYPYQKKLRVGAQLANGFAKARPVPRIARGTITEGQVYLAANQKNGVTRSGIGTNALVVLPEGPEALLAGTEVMCFLL